MGSLQTGVCRIVAEARASAVIADVVLEHTIKKPVARVTLESQCKTATLLGGRKCCIEWWSRSDSNARPSDS